SIFRSPLMFGGDLPTSDAAILDLLTNDEVLAVNQDSRNNRELLRQGDQVIWTADKPDSGDKFLALFNIGEDLAMQVTVDLSALGGTGNYEVRDLWTHADLGIFHGHFEQTVPAHSAKLFRLRPVR